VPAEHQHDPGQERLLQLTPDWLQACIQLDQRALGGLWSQTQWDSELSDPRRPTVGLVQEGMAQGAAHATLEVAEGNQAARGLYEACGFQTAGVRRAYYRNGDDALIQWKRLHDCKEVRIAAHS
jgi:ribosomal-protein-alanine N-acetyltransferase